MLFVSQFATIVFPVEAVGQILRLMLDGGVELEEGKWIY